MKHFSFAVDMKMGVVFISKLLLFQTSTVHFYLGFIFAEQLQENTVIAMEVLVDLLGCLIGSFSQL